jgi:hypothetical protein
MSRRRSTLLNNLELERRKEEGGRKKEVRKEGRKEGKGRKEGRKGRREGREGGRKGKEGRVGRKG